MPKIFTQKNVYEAFMERMEFVYREFDNYYFSVSGQLYYGSVGG